MYEASFCECQRKSTSKSVIFLEEAIYTHAKMKYGQEKTSKEIVLPRMPAGAPAQFFFKFSHGVQVFCGVQWYKVIENPNEKHMVVHPQLTKIH